MTQIEWVLNPDGTRGITVNSKTGCLNHTPEGLCLGGLFPCYAYKLAHGRVKPLYLANHCLATGVVEPSELQEFYKKEQNPFYPRFWSERLEKIRSIQKPTGIFLDDMSDWMGDYWPEEWTRQELQVMRDCPQHRFYTLTKQPQNLIKFSPFPDNCWVGVTATNVEAYDKAILYLNNIQAKVKYISFEPLLGNVKPHVLDAMPHVLDWLIIGALTFRSSITGLYPQLTPMPYGNKDTLQPKIEWVKEIVEAEDKAGLKVFLEDNLKPLLPKDPPYYKAQPLQLMRDIPIQNEWEWRLRQEMPE